MNELIEERLKISKGDISTRNTRNQKRMNLNESNVTKNEDVENPSVSKSPVKSNNYFQMSKNSPEFRSSTQLKDPLIIR